MGLNTLTDRATGQTIVEEFFNDLNTAINSDFVGRNTAGVPTSAQNLGTTAIPWGTVRANSMILAGSTVDPSQITVPSNRVVSGKTRSTSNQPAFIIPNGAALSFLVDGTPTNLVLDINGTSVTVNTDITKGSLTAAPSTNNTALVNDTLAVDQHDTRLWGEPEHRKVITIDTIGSEITALNGKFAAFKLDNGSTTEFFLALVDTTNNRLHKCRRGYFYDSSSLPKNRIFFSDNDVITLMKIGWIFIENNATTVDVTYNTPTWSFTSPAGPATGDYWYDLANSLWKRYDGASFQIINRTFVGNFVNDATNCVAARSEDFFKKYTKDNTLDLEVSTTEIIKAPKIGSKVSVAGVNFEFENSLPSWNITTDLATSADMYDATEQASRLYFAYLKDTGAVVISDIHPYYREDLFGRYHPHNPWRCVGMFFNDSGSAIVQAGGITDDSVSDIWVTGPTGYGSTNTHILIYATIQNALGAGMTYLTTAALGNSFTINEPGMYVLSAEHTSSAGGAQGGISLNSAQLSSSINGITRATVLSFSGGGGAESTVPNSVGAFLKIGDVVRHHTDSTAVGTTVNGQHFRIVKTKSA